MLWGGLVLVLWGKGLVGRGEGGERLLVVAGGENKGGEVVVFLGE